MQPKALVGIPFLLSSALSILMGILVIGDYPRELNLLLFAAVEIGNGIVLLYVSDLILVRGVINAPICATGTLITSACTLTKFIPSVFRVSPFPVDEFQMGFIVLTVMGSGAMAFSVIARKRERLPTQGLLGVAFALFALLGNAAFYALEGVGRVAEETVVEQAMRIERKGPLLIATAHIGCQREVVFVGFQPSEHLHAGKRKIPVVVSIDSSYPRDFDYDPRTATGNLLSHPGMVEKVTIAFHNVDGGFARPSLVIRERCPFFKIYEQGCMKFHCSACVEAEGF